MTFPKLWLDTETTGLKPGHHEVIEIAVVLDRGDDGDVSGENVFAGRIQAQHPERADSRALEINGLNPKAGLDREVIFSRLKKWWANRSEDIEEKVVVSGWNVFFDLQMLDGDNFDLMNELPGLDYHIFDVWPYAKAWKPNLSKLEHFAEHFDLGPQSHSGLGDILLARRLFHRMQKITTMESK